MFTQENKKYGIMHNNLINIIVNILNIIYNIIYNMLNILIKPFEFETTIKNEKKIYNKKR